MPPKDKKDFFAIVLTFEIRIHTLLFVCYFGTPDRSRTYNLFLRTELLYPVELPGHTINYTLVGGLFR